MQDPSPQLLLSRDLGFPEPGHRFHQLEQNTGKKCFVFPSKIPVCPFLLFLECGWAFPAFPGKHRAGKSLRAAGKHSENAENPWKTFIFSKHLAVLDGGEVSAVSVDKSQECG